MTCDITQAVGSTSQTTGIDIDVDKTYGGDGDSDSMMMIIIIIVVILLAVGGMLYLYRKPPRY